MDNKFLMEEYNVKTAIAPVDLSLGTNAGARVGLEKGNRIAIIVTLGTSASGVVQFTFNQHTALSGGSSKVLAIDTLYYKKVGAATSFTKVEPSAKASMIDLGTDFGSSYGVVVFEVLAEDLDVNNGYSHISIDIADVGAVAKVGGATYVVRNNFILPPYSQAV